MNKPTVKSIIRNDIILIISLLVVVSIGMFYLFVLRKQGDTVTVTVDGKSYGTYSLTENITEDIYSGKNNEHLNRFVIKDRKVYMKSANCPDGICVAHKPIFRNGESIVCLPNGVVITISKDKKNNDIDIVV